MTAKMAPTGPAADETAVLVPIKGFRRAKTRLGAVLTAEEREQLARSMAECVLNASAPLPTTVMTDDEGVVEWARTLGYDAVLDPAPTLSSAVTLTVQAMAARGVQRVIVLHADLPLVTDITWLGDSGGVLVVPDRHGDGTNALSVPAAAGFHFSYGPGSRKRHEDEARRLGLPLTVAIDTALAWDVDHPGDLGWPTTLREDSR